MATFEIIAYAILAVLLVRAFIISNKQEKWIKSEYKKAKKELNLQ